MPRKRYVPPRFEDLDLQAELKTLKKIIGGWALRALLTGRPLTVWRRSTPHNWFIKASAGYQHDHLWHIDEFAPCIPNLLLFKKGKDHKTRINNYFGSDSGMPQMTEYTLRKKVINVAKKVGYI